jgi:phosphoribosylformylglycinamidine synthase
MNPHYGDCDTYAMAASAIDEAVRNCVAVGADPSRIAILDNFCWGHTDRPETLGSLVRAALACHDVAVALGTPFISGKDSLNNEFSYQQEGRRVTVSIPSTLLISAMGIVRNVRRCVTMDLKAPGHLVYLVGRTRNEMGGSHFSLVHGLSGGDVPTVDALLSKTVFAALHRAIQAGTVTACHDLSEGGLAVAAAEMAFAGGWGLDLDLAAVGLEESGASLAGSQRDAILLFAESNTRFLCEVPPDADAEFRRNMAAVPHVLLGHVQAEPRFAVRRDGDVLVSETLADLKEAWQAPLRWR